MSRFARLNVSNITFILTHNFTAMEDSLHSSDLPDHCISVNIRTERRIQIFVIASVLCTLLVGALFGDIYNFQNFRCLSETPEEVSIGVFSKLIAVFLDARTDQNK
jgi:hypothetical protein